jgi:hypothetical protein
LSTKQRGGCDATDDRQSRSLADAIFKIFLMIDSSIPVPVPAMSFRVPIVAHYGLSPPYLQVTLAIVLTFIYVLYACLSVGTYRLPTSQGTYGFTYRYTGTAAHLTKFVLTKHISLSLFSLYY